jgi:hypothetical protein
MSTAPSETSGYDPLATSRQPAVGATTKVAAHSDAPTNLPLGVSDLTLSFTDGTPITRNTIPLHDEMPIRFTVKFTNKPEGVDEMVMNVVLSQLSKESYRKGGSGSFSKYVSSTTYEDTVRIMTDDAGVHSISIEVGHAAAPSGGFHGPDGPYDVFVSFAPAGGGGHQQAMSVAAEHDEDDEYPSQIDETLRYTFYKPEIHFMVRLYYAVRRFWDGF